MMLLKKRNKGLLMLSVMLVLISLLTVLSGCSSQKANVNLVKNPGFEQVSNGEASGWWKDMYSSSTGVTEITISDGAKSGKNCLKIVNNEENDARLTQKIEVEPNSTYKISGYIKTQGVSEEKTGANISILDNYGGYYDSVTGDSDWKLIEYYGKTGPKQKTIYLSARLGFYSNVTTGTAYFDDLSVVKVNSVPEEVVPVDLSTSDDNKKSDPYTNKVNMGIMLISLAFIILAVFLLSKKFMHRNPLEKDPLDELAGLLVGVLMVVAFIIRALYATSVHGFEIDMGCFTSWSYQAANAFGGMDPSKFYTGFSDYPPGYAYVLAIIGGLRELFNIDFNTSGGWLLAKMPAIIADLAIMGVLYRISDKRFGNKRVGLILAGLVTLSPLFIVDSAAWGQIDSILSLFMILSIYKFSDRKYISSFVYLVISILIKPQAFVIAPAYLFITVAMLMNREDDGYVGKKAVFGILPLGATIIAALAYFFKALMAQSMNVLVATIIAEVVLALFAVGGYFLYNSMSAKGYFESKFSKRMAWLAAAIGVFALLIIPFSHILSLLWLAIIAVVYFYLFATAMVYIANKNNNGAKHALFMLLPIVAVLIGVGALVLAQGISSKVAVSLGSMNFSFRFTRFPIVGILVIELILAAIMVGGYFLCKKFREKEWFKADLSKVMIAIFVGILVFTAFVVPFSIGQKPTWIAEKYTSTMGQYPYASLSAFNIHTIIGRNLHEGEAMFGGGDSSTRGEGFQLIRGSGQWKDMNAVAVGQITYAALGNILLALLILFLAFLALANSNPKMLGLYSALMVSGVFTFCTQMHERYLFPVVPILLMAYLIIKDRRLLYAMIGFTVSSFVNIALVLFLYYDVSNYIAGDNFFLRLFSIINIGLFIYLATIVWDIAVNRRVLNNESRFNEKRAQKVRRGRLASALKGKTVWPKMTKKDYIIMAVITVIYAVISFINLGSTNTPEKYWSPAKKDSAVVVQLDTASKIDYAYINMNLGEGEFKVEASTDKTTWTEVGKFNKDSDNYDLFKWEKLDLTDTENVNYIKLSTSKAGFALNEFVLVDSETNKPIAIKNVEKLGTAMAKNGPENAFNEQKTAPKMSGDFRQGMYFDEVYHARTGYEFAQAEDSDNVNIYETTHPPLGKVFIYWGIKLFGMNPLGWRFAGNVFGILMLPLMYLFGKRLFKDTRLATVLTMLMALDGMHFVQTRIATIDVFGVFFIILMFYFMYKYFMMNFYTDGLVKTLIPLGLCGVAFGLGVASKWIGLYAGVGLAVIFFISLLERFMEYLAARKQLKETTNEVEIKRLKEIMWKFPLYTGLTILFCLVAFIAVPVVIYSLSYIPYLKGAGKGEWYDRIIENQKSMLSYHSSLVNDKHDFRSQWIEWPLMLRPMWYHSKEMVRDAAGGFRDAVANEITTHKSTISCFGNPIVWLAGVVSVVMSSSVFVKLKSKFYSDENATDEELLENKRNRKTLLFVFIALLSSFVPWMLVARSTFIYHYFASLPFIMILITYICSLFINTKRGWTAIKVFLVVAGILAFIFYPAWSGMVVSKNYIEYLKWLPDLWYF